MKNPLLTIVFCLVTTTTFSQLNNTGATIVIESGATMTLSSSDPNSTGGTINNSGQLIVEQGLVNTGIINSSSANAKIIFTGASSSSFTVGNTQLSTLELQKTGGNLKLLGDLELGNSLIFNSTGSSGIILTFSNLTLQSSATITGASSQAFIQTNGNGMLIKEMSGPGAFTFPVGNGQNLTTLETNVTGTNFSSAKLKVRVVGSKEPNVPGTVVDYIKRHWVVEAENITNYQNEVEGTYLPTDVVGQENLIEGASYDGTDWSYVGAGRGTSSVIGTISAAGVNFTGMEQSVPLPVELLSFSAEQIGPSSAQLKWTTATEQNTSHYLIQRSVDAVSWESIRRLEAKGESNRSLTYQYVDREIAPDIRESGIVYYRLYMVDFDGFSEYSPVDAISFTNEEESLKLYPNPTTGLLNVVTDGEPNPVTVYNALGEVVLLSTTGSPLNLQFLPQGIYRISVQKGDRVQFGTVIKND